MNVLLNRSRRMRQDNWIRDLVAESEVSVNDLILPMFVISGVNQQQPISTLPNVYKFSIDLLIKQVKEAKNIGIKAIALFPSIEDKLKSNDAKEAFNENNLICNTVKRIKDEISDIGVICDVALDPYTIHGHDGIIDKNNYVVNDVTVDALTRQAFLLAKSGCDVIAPSDMMDGRILAIRTMLEKESFFNTLIMSYAAKFSSSLYGPYRDAVKSRTTTHSEIDKKNYQLDIRNSKQAIARALQDCDEGADILLVKPAISYLDIIYKLQQQSNKPIFAYHVSGEYAMLKFAEEKGCCNFKRVMYEQLVACKRAGASAILTYSAVEIAQYLNEA